MKNIKVKPYAQIEENKRLDYISKFDYILMGSVLAIAIIGLLFLEGAMANMYDDGGKSAMTVQIISLIAGAAIACGFTFVDYYIFRLFSWPFYIFNVFYSNNTFCS